ncbi:hypothetical protein MBLNU230_g4791t1 [Neophaeotheca triangularis]
MAPMAKRRRVEDEVRPAKKKPRKFKKQVDYHSSSSEDEGGVKINKHATAAAAEGSNAEPIRPRSILKHKVVEPKPKGKAEKVEVEEEDDDDDDDEEAPTNGVSELEANTALNMGANDSDEEDDEIPTAIEEVTSSSDDEPSALPTDADTEVAQDAPSTDASSSDVGSDADSDDLSQTSSNPTRQRKKRNDPSAFANSISRILDTKLSTAKRTDPVLSRSKDATTANRALADSKLEQKARAQIRSEKKAALEKGRVKDVLALDDANVDTGAVVEEEKRLKKTAQRGVVRLFNAVRAAQVKSENAAKGARDEGVVGHGKREELVDEAGKEGFLELISRGGKKEGVEG